jgi:hypothetical protein
MVRKTISHEAPPPLGELTPGENRNNDRMRTIVATTALIFSLAALTMALGVRYA